MTSQNQVPENSEIEPPKQAAKKNFVPHHSDFHRDVSLWLSANRHLPHEERMKEVAYLMLRHGIDLDINTLRHYAAMAFIVFDQLAQLGDKVPDYMMMGVNGGKVVAENLEKERKTQAGIKRADALHNKPGGNRDKQKQIREIWASGKYLSRDLCAEQECAGLDMSFASARKALRNTPEPEQKL